MKKVESIVITGEHELIGKKIGDHVIVTKYVPASPNAENMDVAGISIGVIKHLGGIIVCNGTESSFRWKEVSIEETIFNYSIHTFGWDYTKEFRSNGVGNANEVLCALRSSHFSHEKWDMVSEFCYSWEARGGYSYVDIRYAPK